MPGYILGIARIDKIGHRRLQLVGFIMMALCFAVIGLVPGMTIAVLPFLIAYGISYFFTEFGPNMTTFVLPEPSGRSPEDSPRARCPPKASCWPSPAEEARVPGD